VLDGLPDVRRKVDRIEEAVLHGSDEQMAFALQRIEQGMGRGVRASDDYCVVILMGRSLTRQLYASQALTKLTTATRAQFDLSQRLGQQLRGKGTAELTNVIAQFLARDPEWVKASKGALVHVKYSATGFVNSIARHQRQAFNSGQVSQYTAAIDTIQETVNEATDPRVRGWLKQQLAEFMQFVDPVQSQVILQSAISENRLVTRPIEGIAYKRLDAKGKAQATLSAEHITERFRSPNEFLVEVHGLLDGLRFVVGTAPSFERAMATLANIVGFQGQRPELEYGRGPDVLWAVGELRFFIIECKNGATNGIISKDDCNQLSGSMNWFHEVYDASCTGIPVMVHPVHVVEGSAAPHPDMRVMTVEKLHEMKAAVAAFAKSAAIAGFPPQPKTIGENLAHHNLLADTFVKKFTTHSRKENSYGYDA